MIKNLLLHVRLFTIYIFRPSSTTLGQVPFTEIYVDSELYSKAIQLRGIRIFQFSCSLFFLNCDYFKEQLFTKTLHMPFGELLKRSNLTESAAPPLDGVESDVRPNVNSPDDDYPSSNTNYGYVDDNQRTITSISSANQIRITSNAFSRHSSTNLFHCIYEAENGCERTVHTVIIDCSGISTIDSAGVRCLEEVIKDFKKISLHCYFANCPSPLLLMLKRMNFIDRLPSNAGIFATIHDAVLNAFTRTQQLPQFLNQQETLSQVSARTPNGPEQDVCTVKESGFDSVKQDTNSKSDEQ